jgi:60 kDa SS-A/Ro ribonucleoprotein
MTQHYLSTFQTRVTQQGEPTPGSGQAPNSAGGYAWEVDCWTRLRRFLVLGSEGGSYYASERALTKENAGAVLTCLDADAVRALREIIDVSEAGRAPKNDPAIFALAMACAHPDDLVRRWASQAIPRVCRTGTHLFTFAEFVEGFRGWGRGLRRGVAAWYSEKDADALAYQLVKYRQRGGWSHRDLLRLAHPKPATAEQDALYRWAVGKGEWTGQANPKLDGVPMPRIVHGYMGAQHASSSDVTAALVGEFRLPREALQSEHLRDPVVWEALLDAGMPMTALIRNLATMTRLGLLSGSSDATRTVVEQLADGERIRGARVHPIQVLAALLTYSAGRSARGDSSWAPVPRIVDALDGAFYASFGNVEATGKRILLALDVSGSMDSMTVAGVPGLTPRVASSAMALVTAATGDPYEVIAFTAGGWSTGPARGGGWARVGGVTPLPFSSRQRLDDVCRATAGIPFGGTDCALPMLWAAEHGHEFDAFVTYTDSETWAGAVHPSQALERYRQRSGIDARAVVVGMVSNGFSIADPRDRRQMDVVGFDTAAPQVIGEFVAGRL